MTGLSNATNGTKAILESQRRANQTRKAAGPSIKLLSVDSVVPDPRVDADGRIVKARAYDLGSPPPQLAPGAAGHLVQRLGQEATLDFVLNRLGDAYRIKPVRPAIRTILDWLGQFPGATWEERWLSSGADAAPRAWRSAVVGPDEGLQRKIGYAANALMAGRVLRPSYGWQLESRAGAHLPAKMLTVNDREAAQRLRALPAYRDALLRHQFDAEGCLSRVMIRTGQQLEQLEGEQLLHYADVVKTSGRQRREHLAWELMVALGPFAGEPATLRAAWSAWSAKGNTRQHSAATLVDRYGIPPSGVRDVLVDYFSEIKTGMDYGSLQGLAYRIARLFWWEVLQINPDQQDLRLDPATAATWRERLAVTTDGLPRREIHSILFAVRGFYRDLAEWSHERIHGEPFPHLFARRIGTRQEVISYAVVRRLLNELAADARLADAGQPIHFTPHDFRRLFTTEMVSSGLPLHIAATLLGHLNLDTTRGYTAVFPDEVIAAHQFFIERRRGLRPFGEMRPASGEEWDEFEQHFLLRKVALGDCHRPYGTPCVHEHACSRCRFLRVDPAQLPRIEEMACNAEARLAAAQDRAWLGEVAALEESLMHLRQRRTEALSQLAPAPPA